jgi:hypothetical protein
VDKAASSRLVHNKKGEPPQVARRPEELRLILKGLSEE